MERRDGARIQNKRCITTRNAPGLVKLAISGFEVRALSETVALREAVAPMGLRLTYTKTAGFA
jgi:hypothetical protein